MKYFDKYIKSVRARGHYSFTSQQAMSELGISQNALNCGLFKLRKKGDLITPVRHLHIIVPPEYQSIGCLSPEELLPILMKHLNVEYYVCLLSAALYHGASHQKPQRFQVMTNVQLKTLALGKVIIEFIHKKKIEESILNQIAVKSGYLKIASPETTAMDLLMYSHRAGGLNHIATVLTELIEKIESKKLKDVVARSHEKSWIQRFGYILEKIELDDMKAGEQIKKVLRNSLIKEPPNFILLAPELPTKGSKRNNDWKIIENTTIESDI